MLVYVFCSLLNENLFPLYFLFIYIFLISFSSPNLQMNLHYIYFVILLCKPIYYQCIQPCGNTPGITRIMQPNLFCLQRFLFFFSFSIQVSRILYSFSTAFRRSSRPADIRDTAPSSRPDSDLYTFTVTLEIKEDDGKGNYRYLVHTYTHTYIHGSLSIMVLYMNKKYLTFIFFTLYNGATVLYNHVAPLFTYSYQLRTVGMTDMLVAEKL